MIAATTDRVDWETLDALRQRQNWKWQKFPTGALPAWVADMDIRPAPVVQQALTRTVDQGDYGYPFHDQDNAERLVQRAFAARMQRYYNWAVDDRQTVCVNDLIQATYAGLMAFSEPGEGVLLQMPSYPPFRSAMARLGRRLVAHDMLETDDGFQLDLEGLDKLVTPDTRVLILCNPHNPTGRVFTRDELAALADIAIARDLIVLSDEIHADLVFDDRRHIPIATLGPEIAARTITMTSASKSFGMPGMRCGIMHFGSPALLEQFTRRVPGPLLGHPGIMGIKATAAAWSDGDPWLGDLVTALQANRDQLVARLRYEAPQLRLHAPEATFMAYLDLAALGLEGTANDFLLGSGGVACSGGETFRADHTAVMPGSILRPARQSSTR